MAKVISIEQARQTQQVEVPAFVFRQRYGSDVACRRCGDGVPMAVATDTNGYCKGCAKDLGKRVS